MITQNFVAAANVDMPDSPLQITQLTNHVQLEILVAPRASRSRIIGVHDGRLKIALTAPPVDDAANEELITFLAKLLGMPKRSVSISKGQRSKRKTVQLLGISLAGVTQMIKSACP